MVQHLGHDQLIDAIVILLVEKAHVSKGQHQLWTMRFGDTLMRATKKSAVSDNVPMSPWKHRILGEQGNMGEKSIDPCDVIMNKEPSAEELWLWQQMESTPHIEALNVSPLITSMAEASMGAAHRN